MKESARNLFKDIFLIDYSLKLSFINKTVEAYFILIIENLKNNVTL